MYAARKKEEKNEPRGEVPVGCNGGKAGTGVDDGGPVGTATIKQERGGQAETAGGLGSQRGVEILGHSVRPHWSAWLIKLELSTGAWPNVMKGCSVLKEYSTLPREIRQSIVLSRSWVIFYTTWDILLIALVVLRIIQPILLRSTAYLIVLYITLTIIDFFEGVWLVGTHLRRYTASPMSLTTNWLSLSSTVHGSQRDTEYVTFNLLLHAAFIRGWQNIGF